MVEHNPGFPYFNGELAEVVHEFEQGLEDEMLLNFADIEAGMERIKASYHQVILAAGGLVKTPEGKTLFINRLNRWDLPKGKVEPGESMDTAALREVAEETGLQNITLGPLLLKTYHTYPYHGHQVIKETHWYAMTAPEQRLAPQTAEDITQALWLTPAEVEGVLQDTYGNIVLVVEAGR